MWGDTKFVWHLGMVQCMCSEAGNYSVAFPLTLFLMSPMESVRKTEEVGSEALIFDCGP